MALQFGKGSPRPKIGHNWPKRLMLPIDIQVLLFCTEVSIWVCLRQNGKNRLLEILSWCGNSPETMPYKRTFSKMRSIVLIEKLDYRASSRVPGGRNSQRRSWVRARTWHRYSAGVKSVQRLKALRKLASSEKPRRPATSSMLNAELRSSS